MFRANEASRLMQSRSQALGDQMLPHGLDHRVSSVVDAELHLSLLEVTADRLLTQAEKVGGFGNAFALCQQNGFVTGSLVAEPLSRLAIARRTEHPHHPFPTFPTATSQRANTSRRVCGGQGSLPRDIEGSQRPLMVFSAFI